MDNGYDAVARVIEEHMTRRNIAVQQLATWAGVSRETIRELRRGNTAARRRSPRTLAAVSTALGLPEDYLMCVLTGQAPTDHAQGQSVQDQLDSLKRTVVYLTDRLAALEEQQQPHTLPETLANRPQP